MIYSSFLGLFDSLLLVGPRSLDSSCLLAFRKLKKKRKKGFVASSWS